MINTTKITRFKENTQGNDYIIGDIHGQWHLVEELLLRLRFDKSKDRLFCCGDLVDRGQQSHLILEYLAKPWFFSVFGNHEQMLLDSTTSEQDRYFYMREGGMWFYYEDNTTQKEIIQVVKDLPLLIEIEYGDKLIGICHAEPLFSDWNKTKELLLYESWDKRLEGIIWGRKRIQVIEMGYDLQEVQGVDLMFCGHSYIGKEPKIYGNTVFIDTGSGYYEDGIPNYPSIIKIEDML